MRASSFGSVSSSLPRTSANDRCDEIFTCSTAMVCDAKMACAVVWVMCALHVMGPRRRRALRGWSSTAHSSSICRGGFSSGLCLLQVVAHVHFAIHPRGCGGVLAGQLLFPPVLVNFHHTHIHLAAYLTPHP